MTYGWTERKLRGGGVELKLDCPLMRGEHRPTILVEVAGQATHTLAQYGHIYATAISGYTRQFHELDEAKAFAGDVPPRAWHNGHWWSREGAAYEEESPK